MTLRRLLLALYSLLFIAACGGLIALTWSENEMLDVTVDDYNLQAFVVASNTAQVIATTILALGIVFGLWTFLLAILPTQERKGGILRLKQADGGTVEVSAQALEQLVKSEIESLPEVRQAVPHVRVAGGGSVATDATVVIEPTASIARVTGEVNDAVKRAFREQVGVVDVKRPNIRISYETIKGQPISQSPRPIDPSRPISPPPAQANNEDTVAWPPPPPGMRGNSQESAASGETGAAVPPAEVAAEENPEKREHDD